jgi:hypothetical protein
VEEWAEHFVGEESDAVLGAEGEEGLEGGLVEDCAGGVAGVAEREGRGWLAIGAG